jgi:hypothetical protein
MRRLLVSIAAVVGVVAVLASGSTSGDSTSASGETNASSDSGNGGGDAGASSGIGDPVRDGKFEFVVNDFKCGVKKVGSEFFEEKAQGQFCLVGMTVKNIGDESQLFDAGNQKGVTDTGATVDADGSASLAVPENENSFLEKINPGNSVDVVVVYDIAKDQQLEAVVLYDSMFSGGVSVSLG